MIPTSPSAVALDGDVGVPVSGGSAAEITRASRSNLALALASLPRRRREDMISFYAFCRIVDDLADEPGIADEVRRRHLDRWTRALLEPNADGLKLDLFSVGEREVLGSMRRIADDYDIDPSLYGQIIEGVSFDIDKDVRFETFSDLEGYCHLVASVVGLVTIEIIGYREASCRDYAVELGQGLQLVNIMRDVGEDYRNEGRVYLAQEDLTRFGYSEQLLAEGRRNEGFHALMDEYAARAYRRRATALSYLAPCDRSAMYCPEVMARTYFAILRKMKSDGYRVFEKRYRVSKARRLFYLAQGMASGWLMRRDRS